MHAVGPRWVDYPDKDRCLTELRRTVVRCLVEASRLKKVSIAMPSISAAIFKVPKELCAHCYMEAVKSFDDFADKLGVVPVKDVWFVDVDEDMVNIIQKKFEKEWHKPVDEKIAHEDFKLAQLHMSKNSDDKFDGSAIEKKDQRKLSHGTKLLDESNALFAQEDVSTSKSYQVNSIHISIVTKPATVYRSTIVVVGELFDELSGLHEFNVKDLAKPIHDLPMQKGEFQYLSLSKPDGSRSTLICQLHPNPDSPDNVTKAFGNLDNAKEIHKSDTVVFTSAIFYAKSQQGQNSTKIISRIAFKLFDFAAAISSTDSAIKSILIATGADYIPQVIKIFEERRASTTPPGRTSRALDSPVDSQDRCSLCSESINIESLKCCRELICSACLGKLSICPFCRVPVKILIGKQPTNGGMSCSSSQLDVHGYERKGSLEINYYFPAGIQAEELQHPSPGRSFKSVTRTAYLPATDDGYRALRLLRVAFHRRLIFTIDVSHTTRMEGIVWNIHHKTNRHSSENGYPDPTYLSRLMDELRQHGVTEESLAEEEKRLVEKLMESLSKKKEAVCRVF
ncbi:unnamed protein product [Lymnaea stagnalis]|uniref:E3 ubiquitin-protein ligase n=1 Tax=Lymnaea stagnalis TaxID=6523 RepID=A0AAV2H146_LYMST